MFKSNAIFDCNISEGEIEFFKETFSSLDNQTIKTKLSNDSKYKINGKILTINDLSN